MNEWMLFYQSKKKYKEWGLGDGWITFNHSKFTHSITNKINLIKYVRTKKRWPERAGAI